MLTLHCLNGSTYKTRRYLYLRSKCLYIHIYVYHW